MQLGLVKADNKQIVEYHCNSFMADYKRNQDYDLHYRNLTHRYEINKIIREDKATKRAEVIYQSRDAKQREQTGIEKMLAAAGIHADEKLIKSVLQLNKKFGVYHTMDMLNDSAALLEKCTDKREKNLVTDFLALWNKKENGE